ncbi:MAG TPA: DUF5667 domain-containing protein, partial [Candidatus Gracilibacteria bacterium]|nr:DUF5667 domain-containing protein [Candidatus Gracilibacteria bacterium]
ERILDYAESSTRIQTLNVFERSGFARSFAGALLLFFFVLTSVLLLPFQVPVTFARATVLDQVNGDVVIVRNNAILKAVPEMELREGDAIVTKDGGSATIRFFDDSLSRLSENTDLLLRRLQTGLFLTSASEIELFLSRGRVWTNVVTLIDDDSNFTIDTTRLQARVEKKAVFDLHETDDSTQVAVFNNVVRIVSSHAPAEVPKTLVAGYSAELADVAAQELAIERLPKHEISQREKSPWFDENLTSDEQYEVSFMEEKEEEIVAHELSSLAQPGQVLSNSEAEQLRLRFQDSLKIYAQAQADLVQGGQEDALKELEEFERTTSEILAALEGLEDPLFADMLRASMQEQISIRLKEFVAFSPNHPLYKSKQSLESIQLELSVSDAEKAETELSQTESMLLEIEQLVHDKKPGLAASTLLRYQERTNEFSLTIDGKDTPAVEETFDDLIRRQADQIKLLTAIEQSLVHLDEKDFREQVVAVREETLRKFVIAFEQLPYAVPQDVLSEVKDLYDTYGEEGSSEEEIIEPAAAKFLAQDYQVSFIDPSGQGTPEMGVVTIIMSSEATMDVAEQIEPVVPAAPEIVEPVDPVAPAAVDVVEDILYFDGEESQNEPQAGEETPDDPELHDDAGLGPSLLFEVVMKRRYKKHFFPEQFFGGELNDDRERLDDEDETDKREYGNGVRHHRNHAQCCPQRQRARVTHNKVRGENVVPDEPDEGADDDRAERGENEKALCERNDGESSERDHEEPPCEPVESVRDVYGVGARRDHQDKERNVPPSDGNVPNGRYVDLVIAKSEVKPVRACGCKQRQPEKFRFDIEPFAFSQSANVEIVIHGPKQRRCYEREKREPGFISVDERVFRETEGGGKAGTQHHDERCSPDEDSSHRRDTFLFCVKRLVHRCHFAARRNLANLFAAAIFLEKFYESGCHGNRQNKRRDFRPEDQQKVAHIGEEVHHYVYFISKYTFGTSSPRALLFPDTGTGCSERP